MAVSLYCFRGFGFLVFFPSRTVNWGEAAAFGNRAHPYWALAQSLACGSVCQSDYWTSPSWEQVNLTHWSQNWGASTRQWSFVSGKATEPETSSWTDQSQSLCSTSRFDMWSGFYFLSRPRSATAWDPCRTLRGRHTEAEASSRLEAAAALWHSNPDCPGNGATAAVATPGWMASRTGVQAAPPFKVASRSLQAGRVMFVPKPR